MFTQDVKTQRGYLDIMETLSAQQSNIIAPKFPTLDALTLFQNATKGLSINRCLCNLNTRSWALKFANLEEVIKANSLTGILLTSLDAIVGTSIQDEKELNLWLHGLACNAFLFGGTSEAVVEMYRKDPYLIAIRFMELVSIDTGK